MSGSIQHNSSDIKNLNSIPLDEIKAAQKRLRGHVVRTPLVKLNYDTQGAQIYLKLENLQDTGAFKQRGAGNALLCLPEEQLKSGVSCPSSGNFAQGVARMATRLGVQSTIIAPDTIPESKVNAIKRHGGTILKVPYGTWWQNMQARSFDGIPGPSIQPANKHVIAGHGTIGLEILEDLPDVDIIMTPFGTGGMAIGVGSAVKALRPEVQLIACEVATAIPLTHSRKVGKPTFDPNHQPSFVDGMGGKSVLPDMWKMAQHLIDETAVLSLEEISNTVRLLLEHNRILAEGAGAAPVAAALSRGGTQGKKIVAVISGGNIDLAKVRDILDGKVPL